MKWYHYLRAIIVALFAGCVVMVVCLILNQTLLLGYISDFMVGSAFGTTTLGIYLYMITKDKQHE